jgi:SSS family solute:Na+ symporter
MSLSPQTLEFSIVLLALAGIGVSGLVAVMGKKGLGVSDYFLAGRNVGWLPLAISLAVTALWVLFALSIGMPSSIGRIGWAIAGLVLVASLSVLGAVYARRYRQAQITTVVSMFRERYGTRVGHGIALVSILLTLSIRVPLTIFVGSRLLNVMWSWDAMSSALLLIVVPGLVVVAGGYRAVMAIQRASGIVAAAGMIALAIDRSDLPFSVLEGLLPQGEAAWGIILLGTLVSGLWYFCVDQFNVQRVLSARTDRDAKIGVGVAAILVACGAAVFSGIVGASGSPAHPPITGLGSGLFGVAIIAFAMATLSGHFMSVATIVTMDVILVYRKRSDDAALVLFGRLTSTVVVFIAILTASSIALMGARNLEWMVGVFAVAVPPLAAVGGIGVLWSRMHGRGAFWGLCVGWMAGIIQSIVLAPEVGTMIQEIVVTFLCAALAFIGVSLAAEPSEAHRPAPAPMLEKGLS